MVKVQPAAVNVATAASLAAVLIGADCNTNVPFISAAFLVTAAAMEIMMLSFDSEDKAHELLNAVE